MDGFAERRFDDGRFAHTVFKGGSGPPVIVLHEVAGLSPGAVAFARRLIDAGFTIHLPLFFGRPEQAGTARGLLGLLCVRREFSLLRVGKSSPVGSWVRALARDVYDPAAGSGVGVVGMCLTGGLALASVMELAVRAAVSAHPGLPGVIPLVPPPLSRRRRGSVDLSPSDLDQAAKQDAPVLALRFRHDPVCPPERLDTIGRCFRAELHRVPEFLEYDEARPPIPRSPLGPDEGVRRRPRPSHRGREQEGRCLPHRTPPPTAPMTRGRRYLRPERAAMLPTRHLEQRRVLDELEAWVADLPDSVQVGIVRELVARCRELTLRANQLQAELRQRVMRVCPHLLSLPGCGALTAAKIVAEVAGVGRFRSEAALAMHAGAAPLECSSGAWQRHRLSRVGNRQLNAALHRIAVTQLRVHPPAQLYLMRLQAGGKSKREALRVLKRRLVRVVFNLLHADLHQAQLDQSAAPLLAHEPAV